MWYLGLYDLVVTETLWRLIDPSDTTIDVGANIGYMTSLMAVRSGPDGRVLAFEPQSNVYAKLVSNVERWGTILGTRIEPSELALSDRSGTAMLNVPDGSEENCGLASLVNSQTGGLTSFVQLQRLDNLINESIAVLKVDVEGHEASVFEGASKLLQSKKIRDIVYEEHREYPTPATELLESYGYAVFNLSAYFRGPAARDIRQPHANRRWEPPSCLATLEPMRALARLRPRGWQTLQISDLTRS